MHPLSRMSITRRLYPVSFVLVAAMGGGLCARGIQLAWLREQPIDAGLVIGLLPHRESGCFPSTHAGVAFAAGWFLTRTRASIIFVWSWRISAALVFGGRVACGLHYPSDVLGGQVVGAACASSALLLAKRRPLKKVTACAGHRQARRSGGCTNRQRPFGAPGHLSPEKRWWALRRLAHFTTSGFDSAASPVNARAPLVSGESEHVGSQIGLDGLLCGAATSWE